MPWLLLINFSLHLPPFTLLVVLARFPALAPVVCIVVAPVLTRSEQSLLRWKRRPSGTFPGRHPRPTTRPTRLLLELLVVREFSAGTAANEDVRRMFLETFCVSAITALTGRVNAV